MTDDERLFRTLVERATRVAVVVDADATVRYANPAALPRFGHAPEDIVGTDGMALVHPEDLDRQRTAWQELVAGPGGTVVTTRYRMRDGSGRWRWVEQRATNLLDDPAVRGVVVAIDDVSDQVERQQALEASREELAAVLEDQRELLQRHRLALEATEVGVWEHDLESDRLYWTEDPVLSSVASERGLTAFDVRTLDELYERIHPGDVDRVRAAYEHAVATRTPIEVEYRVPTPVGVIWVAVRGRLVDDDGGPPRMVGTLRDVTARQEAARQLQQHEQRLQEIGKLTALGELAAGVAHDVNNLLMIVRGSAELLELDVGDREEITQIRETAERGSALTRRLLSFARPDGTEQIADDPARTVESFLAAVPRLLGSGITLDAHVDASTPPVPVSASQLEQILLNLTLNARDAMPDGGTLRVRLRRLPERSGGADARTLRVELEVQDTGTGIESEHLPRVLDPFYTTKVRGQGTGLGLSLVHATVTRAGGTLRIDSTPGEGTTVRMLLPDAPAPRESERRPAVADRPRAPSGTTRVLVCEDDPAVAGLVVQILVDAGCAPVLAHTAAEALSLVRSGLDVDAVLADIDLGDALATEISAELRATLDAPVVYMSGAHDAPPDADEFLPKPVNARRLLDILRRVTGAGEARPG